MSEPVRVLGRRRLSREAEGSTSITRQGGYIQDWVTNVTQETGRPHRLIGWADDIDVSGSRDPFETPGLGPWLRPIDPTCETGACGHTPDTPCMGQWDVLACWKIDRLSRRTIHSYKLLQWCKANKKRIKATNDAIDPDSRVGELIWFILSWLAEGELEAIKERSAGTRQWLIKTDRYPGGWVPYGYRPAPHPDGEGWTLVPDPDMRSVINQMITWILDEGRSAYWTAMRLNEMGIPSPAAARGYNWYKNRSAAGVMSTGGRWSANSVLAILRSKSLLGIRTHKGAVVLSESTGLPVRFAEPLISDQRYTELQETLNRTQPRGRTQNLPSFAKCAVCDHAMYRHSGGPSNRRYSYLICSGRHGSSRFKEGQRCRASMVPEREAWTYLETYLLDHIGDKPWLERVVVPGSDHTRELEEAERALELLLSRAATITSDRARKVFDGQISALDARIRELSSRPVRERRVEWRETGQTFREHWDGLSSREKLQLLRRAGAYVSVLRWPGEISVPALHPDWPVVEFGGVRYALSPETAPRPREPARYHVVLGDLEVLITAGQR